MRRYTFEADIIHQKFVSLICIHSKFLREEKEKNLHKRGKSILWRKYLEWKKGNYMKQMNEKMENEGNSNLLLLSP